MTWLYGFLIWFAVASLSGLLIGRFIAAGNVGSDGDGEEEEIEEGREVHPRSGVRTGLGTETKASPVLTR